MTRIAYQDPLTGVKSKAAFNVKMKELTRDIVAGEEFAIVMVDINNLKETNDRYGHDKGDRYLIGSCRTICTTFKHSPVFRVGGDEFVVILQNDNYEDREYLLEKLETRFEQSHNDDTKKEWERYWAATGMAEYQMGSHETVEDVLKRADEEMYKKKMEMKGKASGKETEQ
jgi:diguanylate cyclase (GGDEF)-like protein